MELRHLRLLSGRGRTHFARAAERLHIEQSPLSRTIKELEEDLGEQLFVRTSRSTRLTRAGRQTVSGARAACSPAAGPRQREGGSQWLPRPSAHCAVRWHHALTLADLAGDVSAGGTRG